MDRPLIYCICNEYTTRPLFSSLVIPSLMPEYAIIRSRSATIGLERWCHLEHRQRL